LSVNLIYTVGQPVEALNASGHWREAVVFDTDADDARLTYRVEFPDGVKPWVALSDIRPRGPVGPVLQYRTRFGSGTRARYGDWMPLTAGIDVRVEGAWGIETREAPRHSDAEIVAEFRKFVKEQRAIGIVFDDRFTNILGGNF
jgi:hypothetical protein